MKTKQFFIGSLFLIMVAAVITAVFITSPAHAATTITVNTTTDVLDGADGLCSLREAVYAANNNVPFGGVAGECPAGTDADTDIITLADGATYTLSIPGVDEDATVSGDLDILDNTAVLDVQINVANNGGATIDADDIDRVLHIKNATVELNNIALVDGSASPSSFKSGGCVLNNNGILTMNGGEVRLGDAVLGGGIYNYSSTPTGGKAYLNGTHVILNVADTSGGIFSGGDNSALMLNGAVVRANNSNSDGGGVLIASGNLLVEDSTISLNSAGNHGGGIHAAAANVTITGSLIEANEATGVDGRGGGIYLADSTTQANTIIQNSTIKDNNAFISGGGLSGDQEFDTGPVTIKNSDFSGNRASNSGAIAGYSVIIIGGTFDDNHATDGGAGAIYALSLIITDTVLTNNTATDEGGAINVEALTASNVRIKNNQAGGIGGGMYLWGGGGGGTKDISNSVIISNTATNGGGIYAVGSDGIVNISKTAVTNNTAINDGGGIWINDGNLFISNSTISSNSADSSGGGFYIDTTGAITATNVTIALNTPGQDVYKVGELTLQNSIIHTPATPNCSFVATPIISLGNNISDDNSCGGLNQPGDAYADAQLAPLTDNGGNTLTHYLLDGSPAIDSGNAAACAAPPVNNVDQRGIPRIIGSSCDKGAVERGSVIFLPAILK